MLFVIENVHISFKIIVFQRFFLNNSKNWYLTKENEVYKKGNDWVFHLCKCNWCWDTAKELLIRRQLYLKHWTSYNWKSFEKTVLNMFLGTFKMILIISHKRSYDKNKKAFFLFLKKKSLQKLMDLSQQDLKLKVISLQLTLFSFLQFVLQV